MRALLLLPLLASCSLLGGPDRIAEELRDPRLSQDPALLVGAWDWTHDNVFGDGGPARVTAAGAGRTERVVFSAEGAVAFYRDGAREREGTYAVEEVCRPDTGACFPVLRGEGWWPPLGFGASGRKLVMSWAAADGPERVFRRAAE